MINTTYGSPSHYARHDGTWHHCCFGCNSLHHSRIDHQSSRFPFGLVSIVSIGIVRSPLFSREGVQGGEVGWTVAGIVKVRWNTAIGELNVVLRNWTSLRPLITEGKKRNEVMNLISAWLFVCLYRCVFIGDYVIPISLNSQLCIISTLFF